MESLTISFDIKFIQRMYTFVRYSKKKNNSTVYNPFANSVGFSDILIITILISILETKYNIETYTQNLQLNPITYLI